MTTPIYFSKNSAHSISSFSFDERPPDHTEKLISLFKDMILISNETSDCQGNHSRLWALTNGTFLGTVSHPDGKITCISSDKIINSCTNKPISMNFPYGQIKKPIPL